MAFFEVFFDFNDGPSKFWCYLRPTADMWFTRSYLFTLICFVFLCKITVTYGCICNSVCLCVNPQ